MREKLAELCHCQWSGWMTYLYGKCSSNADGSLTIPLWAVARWARQMSTKYEHLPEVEKESDREEADRFLALLVEENRHSAQQLKAEIAALANQLELIPGTGFMVGKRVDVLAKMRQLSAI